LKALIEQQAGYVVCAETDHVAAAIDLVRSARPNIAIADISLPGENGLDLVTALRVSTPDLPVLVVSMHDEEFYATRARNAGAVGYVMKQHAGDRIIEAVRRILAGKTAFSDPQKRRTWDETPVARAVTNGIEDLSARESEVLGLMGNGYSTREIADKLGLSVKTIDTYREKLKVKLNLETGERLVYFAVRWAASQSRPVGGVTPSVNE
jgi:DNA-binding NarL/FixJ family response regulator